MIQVAGTSYNLISGFLQKPLQLLSFHELYHSELCTMVTPMVTEYIKTQKNPSRLDSSSFSGKVDHVRILGLLPGSVEVKGAIPLAPIRSWGKMEEVPSDCCQSPENRGLILQFMEQPRKKLNRSLKGAGVHVYRQPC
ncbi:hypothetical protein CA598_11885 [Paenibacillus sp. VTT E-133291]|nr:hypothetical protein CA598_11885 [Paenibacillus sp. VTT E-133291]